MWNIKWNPFQRLSVPFLEPMHWLLMFVLMMSAMKSQFMYIIGVFGYNTHRLVFAIRASEVAQRLRAVTAPNTSGIHCRQLESTPFHSNAVVIPFQTVTNTSLIYRTNACNEWMWTSTVYSECILVRFTAKLNRSLSCCLGTEYWFIFMNWSGLPVLGHRVGARHIINFLTVTSGVVHESEYFSSAAISSRITIFCIRINYIKVKLNILWVVCNTSLSPING